MIDLPSLEKRLSFCPCGKKHVFSTRQVEIRSGLTKEIGSLLRKNGFDRRIRVVCDRNTIAAAPDLEISLLSAGFRPSYTVFDSLLSAEYRAFEQLKQETVRGGDRGILSCGTGSLNDIGRLAASELGLPFAIFATAPSMDGFASSIAPINVSGFKTSFDSCPPVLIAADTDILTKAPQKLKAAGLGDILGKYTALADWKIASLVTGEYFCPQIADLTQKAVDMAVGLASEDGSSSVFAQALMEALVFSGLAMQLCGCSRPASGAEHHISHFIEMKTLSEGHVPEYHGRVVGVSSCMVAEYYGKLAGIPQVKACRNRFDPDAVSAAFGDLWEGAKKENTPDPLSAVSPETVVGKWQEIRSVLKTVPGADEIRKLLKASGGVTDFPSLNLPDGVAETAVKYGKYTRSRLTMLRFSDFLDVPECILENEE